MTRFDWKDYLLLANEMQSMHSPSLREAVVRTIVGRAYYASYNDVRSRIGYEGFQPTGRGSDHVAVQDFLLRMGRRETADLLRELRTMRNRCDYRDEVWDPESMAVRAISLAREACKDEVPGTMNEDRCDN